MELSSTLSMKQYAHKLGTSVRARFAQGLGPWPNDTCGTDGKMTVCPDDPSRKENSTIKDFVFMAIKSDRWIRKMAREYGMIDPFSDRQVREGVISYGVSSYGYDLRVADEFKIFTNVNSAIVDPKKFDARSFIDVRADS